MRANDFLTEQPGTIAVTNMPIYDKNISMKDQQMQKFKQQMQKDGGYQYTSQATKDAIKQSDKRVQDAMRKQARVDAIQGAGASSIQRVKPVTFPKATSTAQIAMDDINEAFEYAMAEAREIDPKKMQAYMDFKKENNIDGSSVRMAVDNPDHPETKRMMQDKNFAKAVSMYKAALVNEDVSELTFEDDDQFFEDFGYLGYSIDENDLFEAEYRGRKVKLNKPMQGDVKKFKVYVKNKKGNVIKVNFGHGGSSVKGKTMRIRKNNPKARKNFRARHNCDNPGPKTKARYWSCRKW